MRTFTLATPLYISMDGLYAMRMSLPSRSAGNCSACRHALALSVMEQDSLASVLKSLRKENFIAVSISLDVDKEAWLNYSDRDTTQWKQVCDFKGWNSNVVKSQGVESLPYHILLDPNKRVVEKNIALKDLVGKMKSLNERNNKKRR